MFVCVNSPPYENSVFIHRIRHGQGLDLTTGIRLVQMVSISERKFLHLQPMIGTQTRVRNRCPEIGEAIGLPKTKPRAIPVGQMEEHSPRQKTKLSSPVNHTEKKGYSVQIVQRAAW